MSLLSRYPSFVGLLALQPLLLDANGSWSFPVYAIPLMFVMMAGMGLMMWLMMRMMMGMGGHNSSHSSGHSDEHMGQQNAKDREVSDLRAEVAQLREQLAASSKESAQVGSANHTEAAEEGRHVSRE